MSSDWLKPETLKIYLPDEWSVQSTGNPDVLQLINEVEGVSATIFLENQLIDSVFMANPPCDAEPENTDDWCGEAERTFDLYARDDWDLVGFEQDGPPDLMVDTFQITLSRKLESVGQLQAILRWLSKAPNEADMEDPTRAA